MAEMIETLWNVRVSLSKFCVLVGRDLIITQVQLSKEELKFIREPPNKLFIHRLKYCGEG